MSIECSKFDAIWGKAVQNIGAARLLSTYTWTDGVESVVRSDDSGEVQLQQGQAAPAVFFDNADYPVWVEFANGVREASFGSMLQSENERFGFRRGILAGFVNYGNEVGRSEIAISYRVGTETRRFVFGFEVLSTKLDYHDHWRKMVEDIEAEYRMLSLDFMRRTFHGFTPDTRGETPELVWWSIFQGEQRKFLQACRNIVERPRRRLHGHKVYLRADQLKHVPTMIENELAEHRMEHAHRYCVEEQLQSNDTQENRFLKYALRHIAGRYDELRQRIEAVKNISDVLKADMLSTLHAMRCLCRHPFFRTVGSFKGLSQESLVLQKATGYSQVYRTWHLLRRAYSLNDGIYRLQSKDIATLYEIWCFIEVSHIVRHLLGLNADEVEHRNRTELSGMFTWTLGKGGHSRILFRKDDVELAELIYNPKHVERENDIVSISYLVSPTVAQKPDIVLQLTKNDLSRGMKMTYLFDAKYRIDGKAGSVDIPPEDAINQMHRYRDAIYYREYDAAPLKKEVIGGYILFPGGGEPADVEVSKFYKTIGEVNIGAFPLRPNDGRNRRLLEDFIRSLIERKSTETISQVIPQKGTFVEVGDRVLVGLVKPNSRRGYLDGFKDGKAVRYYTGSHFPTTIALQDLHFFVPYVKGLGIRDVYEITRIRTIAASEVKQTEGDGAAVNDIRLTFELKFSRRLSDGWQRIDTHGMIDYTFFDTTFEGIGQLMGL
ncbi:hypothetical protein JCM15908A_16530 [Prevotella dentasini JCM 15908]